MDLERENRFLAAHASAHDGIYRFLRRRTEGAATAEDLCAEVFRIVWEKSSQGMFAASMLAHAAIKATAASWAQNRLRSSWAPMATRGNMSVPG